MKNVLVSTLSSEEAKDLFILLDRNNDNQLSTEELGKVFENDTVALEKFCETLVHKVNYSVLLQWVSS